jgi:VIT1/CCC1 family predicted Fe2+/Mn2+ transporter
MASEHDDFPDNNSSKGQTFIVKDERAALKMKREETKEAQARYKAIVERERAEKKAEREMRREEIQLELARIKLNTSATEAARLNLAKTTPFILCILIGGFIIMLGTGAIPDESVSVASALLTLLVTGLMANLRSIISEGSPTEEANGNGNGHDDPKPKSPTKKLDTPKPKDTK